jgi:hypothetical protein
MTKLPKTILSTLIGLIIILLLVAGCVSPGAGPSTASQTPPEMDARCEMQELNMTFFHNWTIVPITDEDLRPFPEFAIYLRNEDASSSVLVRSFRSIKQFSCNESRAIGFIALSRKFEENPNQPVLEYHGRYYQLSSDSYFGTTARPTIVAGRYAENLEGKAGYSKEATPCKDCPPQEMEGNPSDPVPGERVIASYGLDGNNPDRTVFLNNPELAERFLNASEADIRGYYYPKGPVIGYGKDMRGSIVVMIDDSQKVNLTVVSEIHDRISARGRTFDITNVPCKFVLAGIVEVSVPRDTMS